MRCEKCGANTTGGRKRCVVCADLPIALLLVALLFVSGCAPEPSPMNTGGAQTVAREVPTLVGEL